MNKRFVLISIVCLVVQGCADDSRFASLSGAESISAQLAEIYDISQSDLSADEMADRHLRFFAETPTLLPVNQAAIVGREAVADFYHINPVQFLKRQSPLPSACSIPQNSSQPLTLDTLQGRKKSNFRPITRIIYISADFQYFADS